MQTGKTFLDEQRLMGDEGADSLIDAVFAGGEQSILYDLIRLEAVKIKTQTSSSIKKFLVTQKTQPAWFDSSRLLKGQRIFRQYAVEIMSLLGAMSLPYCYAASPGNKALYLSDKMRNAPGKRLMDTASFVIDVLTPGNLDDDKTGHIHINKVRLIHALSRYYLKKHPTWDMAWGQPINQEDMAGTNLAFSYVILLGLQMSGLILSNKEKEDFLYAWRYIGYLLNINEELLPSSFSDAGLLATIIKNRNFQKTEEGAVLTAELLAYYKASVPTWQAPLVQSQVRYYLGPEVADYIGLSPDPVRDTITSSISTFQSLRNMLTVKRETFQLMLYQHAALKNRIS